MTGNWGKQTEDGFYPCYKYKLFSSSKEGSAIIDRAFLLRILGGLGRQ